jgi:predicted  nucleic acid-binding Zn-ribbon protein
LSPLEAAEERLARALNALKSAVDLRIEREREWASLESQLSLAHEDRAELAERLDHAMAETHRLEKVSREVSVRIDNAMSSISDALSEERR